MIQKNNIYVCNSVLYNNSRGDFMEYNISITNLRKELYKVNESILDTGMIVNVSSKKGEIIMMSKDKYNSLVETLYLSSSQ